MLPLLAAHGGLLIVFDLSHRWIWTFALLGVAFLWLPFAVRRLVAAGAAGRVVLGGALALRLLMLPLAPTLSDDAWRYLWDGKVAAAGFNPYVLPPESGSLAPLRDEAWRRLPHAAVPTVYPPLAIAAFSIAARLPFPMLAWKALVAAADLGVCALLIALARRRGLPPALAAWYAWNPLPILEGAGMGHVDALGVAGAAGAVLLLTGTRRPLAAGVSAAAGVLAKLGPLAALPLWARNSGGRRRPLLFLAAALGLPAVALLPVVASAGGVPPGLVTYGVSWEFNGPLYEPLWRLLDAAGAAPAAQGALDRLKEATGLHEALNRAYPYLYPQLLAKLLLAGGMGAAVLLSIRERDPLAGTGRLFGRLLLLSATVYPWYLLWVLPWAALAGGRGAVPPPGGDGGARSAGGAQTRPSASDSCAPSSIDPAGSPDPPGATLERGASWAVAWRAASGLVLLSYLPQVAGVPYWPGVWAAVWGPFFLLGFLPLAAGRPRRAPG